MPCVNKVMEPHDKQMKLTALFLERNLVNRSDLKVNIILRPLLLMTTKASFRLQANMICL